MKTKSKDEYSLHDLVHIVNENLMEHEPLLQQLRHLIQERDDPQNSRYTEQFEWVKPKNVLKGEQARYTCKKVKVEVKSQVLHSDHTQIYFPFLFEFHRDFNLPIFTLLEVIAG